MFPPEAPSMPLYVTAAIVVAVDASDFLIVTVGGVAVLNDKSSDAFLVKFYSDSRSAIRSRNDEVGQLHHQHTCVLITDMVPRKKIDICHFSLFNEEAALASLVGGFHRRVMRSRDHVARLPLP